jgi:hypothetical protein
MKNAFSLREHPALGCRQSKQADGEEDPFVFSHCRAFTAGEKT